MDNGEQFVMTILIVEKPTSFAASLDILEQLDITTGHALVEVQDEYY